MGHSIQWAKAGAVCTYTEYVSLTDIIKALAAVNADARLQSDSYLIHNFAKALHIDSGAAALITIAGHTLGGGKELLTVKTAVVTTDTSFAPVVRSFISQSVRQVQCFASLAEAKLWLGIE